jgi:hypothetical protein
VVGWQADFLPGFVWTGSSPPLLLASILPTGVSLDGRTVLGRGLERWTEAGGLEELSDGPGAALAVSGDGSLIGGRLGPFDDLHAFVWNEAIGVRRLDEVLTSLGVDLTGWTLLSVVGVSADGHTLLGEGRNPAGRSEAWLATIPVLVPEPGTIALLGLGVALLGARRALRESRSSP